MRNYPKTLVVSINAWQDKSGINTLLNLFKKWDKKSLAQIYTRSELPSTKKCDLFFQIPEGDVIRKFFLLKKKVGGVVRNSNILVKNDIKSSNLEKCSIYYGKFLKSWILAFCREMIWFLSKYNKSSLNNFIDDFNPDVFFLPIYPLIYMNRLQYSVIKNRRNKIVAFIGDDNYSYNTGSLNPLFYIYRFFLRRYIKRIITKCDTVFVMTPKMKYEYDKIFGINSVILTKGIDFSNNRKCQNSRENHFPIKVIYTGKLIYGRYKSILLLIDSIKRINVDGIKIQLYIYSGDNISKSLKNKLNDNSNSFFMGSVSYDCVAEVLKSADVVLFVESLSFRYKNIARLSFSTKLTDYMQFGKCIFAIGDKNIAPIDYLKAEDAALVSCSEDEIFFNLSKIVDDDTIIQRYSQMSYNCGLKNHDENIICERLYNMLSLV